MLYWCIKSLIIVDMSYSKVEDRLSDKCMIIKKVI